MDDVQARISMSGQIFYADAIKRYGPEFAEAVVQKELQLHADNLDCFDEYATYDFMQSLIKTKK